MINMSRIIQGHIRPTNPRTWRLILRLWPPFSLTVRSIHNLISLTYQILNCRPSSHRTHPSRLHTQTHRKCCSSSSVLTSAGKLSALTKACQKLSRTRTRVGAAPDRQSTEEGKMRFRRRVSNVRTCSTRGRCRPLQLSQWPHTIPLALIPQCHPHSCSRCGANLAPGTNPNPDSDQPNPDSDREALKDLGCVFSWGLHCRHHLPKRGPVSGRPPTACRCL